MSAIGASGASPQPVAINVRSVPQEESKGAWETTKEVVGRAWNAFLIGLQAGWDKLTFIFFRVLEWIHPSLGPRFENIFLRISNVWQSIKEAWRSEEARRELDQLRIQNQQMQERAANYDRIFDEHAQLSEQNQRLIHDNQWMTEQARNLLEREQAGVDSRNILFAQNRQMEGERETLIRQRNEAVSERDRFFANIGQLNHQLAAAQQQVRDLESQTENRQELDANLAHIAQACDQIHSFGSQTALSNGLNELLPLLLDQLQQAQTRIAESKDVLRGTSAEIAVQSVERILNEMRSYFTRVPEALRLHENWNHHIGQLVLHFQQPFERVEA